MVWILLGVGVLAFLVETGRVARFSIIYFCVLIPSIILHEVSHGFVANALGDDTAKRAGRLTLNPLAHVDPMGSVVVPALLVLTTNVAFGWAKPVPVSVNRLRRPRDYSVLVALAGPATNAVLFVACALAFRVWFHPTLFAATSDQLPLWSQVALVGGLANISVGLFNLVPIPPLDGSAVVERLVPARSLHAYYRMRPFGMILVFLFALFVFRSAGVGTHLLNAELHLWNAVSGSNFGV
ncbi:MAG TPA: site-2 protease family protein [Acidimicrobiales bacterium]|nr:site-2 protease family protein [Acidimicrobiales bacterium]